MMSVTFQDWGTPWHLALVLIPYRYNPPNVPSPTKTFEPTFPCIHHLWMGNFMVYLLQVHRELEGVHEEPGGRGHLDHLLRLHARRQLDQDRLGLRVMYPNHNIKDKW